MGGNRLEIRQKESEKPKTENIPSNARTEVESGQKPDETNAQKSSQPATVCEESDPRESRETNRRNRWTSRTDSPG